MTMDEQTRAQKIARGIELGATEAPEPTSDQRSDADGWVTFRYADDDRLLSPDDLDTWKMAAASYLDQRADNRYGDYGWQARNRTYTWSRTARKWLARVEYRAKPDPHVIDLAKLSARLDHAAGAVHVLTGFDVDELRSLADDLKRVAAALDGDATVKLVPYPWS